MSNRHTFLRLSFSAVIAIVGLSISMLTYAQSEEEKGTITIEQKNPSSGTLGNWTLFVPGNNHLEGKDASTVLPDMEPGSYRITGERPDGMTVSIRIFKDGTLFMDADKPQLSFTLEPEADLRIIVYYHLSQFGVVAATSDPPGMTFTIKGPNATTLTGVTPASFDYVPVGQYSIQFDAIAGCATPAIKSDLLTIDSRVSFNVTIACKNADKLRSRQETTNEDFVNVKIDGEEVQLRDVPKSSWFSAFVFNAARRNVLSGYKDETGRPSGLFGPENNITLGELAKIAHRVSSTSEGAFNDIKPENANALSQWFSPFIASAESRGWVVYQDTELDPLRPATRAEVIMTLLQALDIQLQWAKGNIFHDVLVRTRYAGAIETAAADKIIDGRTDEAGEPTNMFDPEAPINRAEIAKVIHQVMEIYILND